VVADTRTSSFGQGTMAPHTPVRILVIDDELSFARVLAQLLRLGGYVVDTAENGQVALAQLQMYHYDVLLCDLLMPALDGLRFYETLIREEAALRQRVIFLTGDTLSVDSMAFLAQCGQPWLSKPCRAADVRRVIQQMLGSES
jgi:two-component system, OmpR family, response regulator